MVMIGNIQTSLRKRTAVMTMIAKTRAFHESAVTTILLLTQLLTLRLPD